MLGRSFVRADLQRVNRTRTPWVVVNGHRPMYPSSLFGQHHSSDLTVAQDLRSAFEELFLRHQVQGSGESGSDKSRELPAGVPGTDAKQQ